MELLSAEGVVLAVADEQQKLQTARFQCEKQVQGRSNTHSRITLAWRGMELRCASVKNANLYISEQTSVSRKSKIDLQQKERFDGSPSPGSFSTAIASAEDIERLLNKPSG